MTWHSLSVAEQSADSIAVKGRSFSEDICRLVLELNSRVTLTQEAGGYYMSTVPNNVLESRPRRPRDRRGMILAAATQLFYRRGYSDVVMADIATEVGVGASAIYRHFSGKAELLIGAIKTALVPFDMILETGSGVGLDNLFARLADSAVKHRELGVLWQREARNLSENEQAVLRRNLRSSTNTFASLIQPTRPGLSHDDANLLTWCVMGVLMSVSFHRLRLPPKEFRAVIVELATFLTDLNLPNPANAALSLQPRVEKSISRKEILVKTATELFAEHGFGAVGIDQIGEAAGIAGPTIYRHFENKQAILLTAMQRGNDRLVADAILALKTSSGPAVKLRSLIKSYVNLAVTNRFLLRTLLSEQNQLSPEHRVSARRQQLEYIQIWSDLLQDYKGYGEVSARIRVQAVLLVINDAVQTPHLRSRPGFEATLQTIAAALLDLPAD